MLVSMQRSGACYRIERYMLRFKERDPHSIPHQFLVSDEVNFSRALLFEGSCRVLHWGR